MNKPIDGAWLRPDPAAMAGALGKPAWVQQMLLRAMAEGALVAGCRLPSARTMAREWGVSRGVIDQAFAQLQDEGLIERRVGDGSYVTAAAARIARDAAAPARPQRPPSAAALRALQRVSPLMAAAEAVQVNRAGMDQGLLAPGLTDTASFDLPAWRRELARAWADEQRRHLDYGHSAGLWALRESTARWLSLTRGMAVAPEQVLILNGPVQALELVSRVLFEPGDAVCVEEPSFVGAPRILAMAGLRVVSAPLDENGLQVAAARARQARPAGIYVNPQNQFPTTLWTTLERRRELLAWAHDADAWVLESDYFNEVVFSPEAPPPTLYALDEDERVLHTGSWNMTMFPSLRIGWLVLPRRLVRLFGAVRGLYGEHITVPHQAALAAFIDSGALSRRVRELQRLFGERRNRLFEAAARDWPAGLALRPMRGGATACLPLDDLPPQVSDVALARAAAACGVPVEALSEHAWHDRGSARDRRFDIAPPRGLVLGVGQTPCPGIAEGVARLAPLLDAARRGHRPLAIGPHPGG